jgi:hypothetical protein
MTKPEIMLKIMLIAEKSHGIELRLFCKLRAGSKLKNLTIKNIAEKKLVNRKILKEVILRYIHSIPSGISVQKRP